MMEKKRIRPPAVAGMFYPSEPKTLREMVGEYLSRARETHKRTDRALRALIVPHAGYIYSGPIAASAYCALEPLRDRIRRVFLFGPSHFFPVEGLALPGADGFETPLGVVPVDQEGCGIAGSLPQVSVSGAAHASEHSLEVQLPFLQETLADFSLVPFSVGEATATDVAEVMERLSDLADSLIVVSSDLSHFLPYENARNADGETGRQILRLEGPLKGQRACGAAPISGLLKFAEESEWEAELLDLRNSGDTAGDKGRVVGYGAFRFTSARPS